MSCSSNRNRLLGSCSSTLVSSTNSLVGPVLRTLRARLGVSALTAGAVSGLGATSGAGAEDSKAALAGILVLRDAGALGAAGEGATTGVSAAAAAGTATGWASPRVLRWRLVVGVAPSGGAMKASGSSRAARRVGAGGRGMVRKKRSEGFRKQKAAGRPRRLVGRGEALRSTAAS